jgi:hypothetical protein
MIQLSDYHLLKNDFAPRSQINSKFLLHGTRLELDS